VNEPSGFAIDFVVIVASATAGLPNRWIVRESRERRERSESKVWSLRHRKYSVRLIPKRKHWLRTEGVQA